MKQANGMRDPIKVLRLVATFKGLKLPPGLAGSGLAGRLVATFKGLKLPPGLAGSGLAGRLVATFKGLKPGSTGHPGFARQV
ncbi:hypothetical protein [Desulfofundulus kuznetsovii]|uniref:hypothetical protein n=1 Tax=Desulfofundulus kuznetsovii TaxID=58135 RepID=UPI003EB93F59